MKKGVKLFIIFILIVIIAIMAWFKAVKPKEKYSNIGGNSVKEENIDYEANVGKMPVLLELSSPTCGPCRKMAPIIKEVKEEYKDTVDTHIIDLTKNPEFGEKYKVSVVPTQVFLDKEGKVFFRHEGMLTKEEIVDILNKIGVK
ncbi:thioredoxin family protein [Clostridium botulinum]|uniref:Thioredoxin n=1 Tax=Clostridium botulinum TaxID=1491 RepID=A0A846JEL7_CLOBO|nr:thioredoxin family protein [Clostridium botulinum]ACA55069.1 thioredoxin family protein [Clostridium botulinum A3 str. Loch Maree]NFH66952.1 thioredoxin family protein [Clostridium botulinum]NFJ10517.1 thioredoxin family protein [Clostridium botulinum]NFK15231.1 thioredoxin family protein [Clostridium botulinum]NFM95130.1 thioredoxin family protein [Clostridium botulinum]